MSQKQTISHKATQQQVNDFIDLFNGNIDAALSAVREQRISAKRISRAKPHSNRVIIHVQDLAKSYRVGRQRVDALSDISLDIYEGEFVAIVAPSGSGKSTLLQLMGGLEKPSRGNVTIDGTNLGDMTDRQLSKFRGQTIGFVFQFFYLQPFLNLERNLEVPGMFAHVTRSERLKRVRELASTVGIENRLAHYPKELSGGQIQRAAVVRALLNNPKVILADEPTGNLDSKNSTAIIDLFERIRKDFGTTIVIATHDMAIAEHADRIINLKDGVIT